jgi:predicted RND superfamily exporter protein
VFLTTALLFFIHVDMQYLAPLIVQSIMMGATIDYAIVYTSYYIESRALLDPKEAIRASFKGSLQTILTSATILIAAVGLLSFAFGDPSVRQICRILSIGSLIATVLVIFILPAILACLDRLVIRRQTK